MPEHPEYRDADPVEKALVRTECKRILPITEELKARIRLRYQQEYQEFLDEQMRINEEKERKEAEPRLKRLEIEKELEREEMALKFREYQESAERYDSSPSPPVPRMTQEQPSAPPPEYHNASGPPSVDRSSKPRSETHQEIETDGLRSVMIPLDLKEKFLEAASLNTHNNIETGGILAGKFGQKSFRISHVLIPKQKGTSDSCLTQSEEEIFEMQDKHDLVTIGWIHTHPSQSAFMSSIDLHTHCSYQLLLPEAVAVVCSPKHDEMGVFSLTPDHGLQFVANCTKTGFHPHPNESQLYRDSHHVIFDDLPLTLIDLR